VVLLEKNDAVHKNIQINIDQNWCKRRNMFG